MYDCLVFSLTTRFFLSYPYSFPLFPHFLHILSITAVPPLVEVVGYSSTIAVFLHSPIAISIEVLQARPFVKTEDIEWTFSNSSALSVPISRDMLTADRLHFMKNASTLHDEGNYTVRVKNPAGVFTTTVLVIIQGNPILLKPAVCMH